MTGFPSWTTSEVVTAAKMRQVSVDFVRKTADESVTSSTTLQNDDHLAYTVGATGTYAVDVYLFAVSAANAAGDINVGFSFPTGTMHWGGSGLDVTLASSVDGTMSAGAHLSATSGTSAHGFGLSTATTLLVVHGLLIATATGTLQFMWCQNSSNANASTVKAGSYMLVRQVA